LDMARGSQFSAIFRATTTIFCCFQLSGTTEHSFFLYHPSCRIKRYAQLALFSKTHILLLNRNLNFLSAFSGPLRLPYKVCISRIMSFLYKSTKTQQQKLAGIQISVRCLKMPKYAGARSA
jgi:hypothetical protein